MAWTNPKTWMHRENLTASDMNVYVRDNMDFLLSPPGCLVTNGSAGTTAVSTASTTTVDWKGTEVWDTDAFHHASSNTTRLTVPTGLAGKYKVQAMIRWNAEYTNSWRHLYLRLNGTDTISLSNHAAAQESNETISTGVHVYDLAVGDYVEVRLRHEATGTITLEQTCTFSIQWLSF